MILPYSPLLFPLLAWVFSLAGTALALSMLKTFAVMDTPNARSNHDVPVPRGGGIAMVAFALLFLLAAGVDIHIIIAASVLAVISFADDLRGVPVPVRLGAQAVAVIVALPALHGRILPEFIPLALEQAFIVIGWIWFINLTNFMDGIDGITSLETIAIAAGVCLIATAHTLSIQASVIAAATLGFFWFNRSPAKLFMGDTGSITLGFLTGYLLINLSYEHRLISALILPAYYVSDATFTLFKRLLRGEKVWQAHSEHAYQHAVRNGMTHSAVVRVITALNACLVVLAIFATPDMIGVIMLIGGYAITALVMRHLMAKGSSRA